MTPIEVYYTDFPESVQELLEALHEAIAAAAPDAEVLINYGIPTFKLEGNLVHYAAYKQHIGFYPGPSGIAVFKDELAPYKSAKGSVQFPLNEALPLDVVTRIVQFRVAENLEKAAAKRKK